MQAPQRQLLLGALVLQHLQRRRLDLAAARQRLQRQPRRRGGGRQGRAPGRALRRLAAFALVCRAAALLPLLVLVLGRRGGPALAHQLPRGGHQAARRLATQLRGGALAGHQLGQQQRQLQRHGGQAGGEGAVVKGSQRGLQLRGRGAGAAGQPGGEAAPVGVARAGDAARQLGRVGAGRRRLPQPPARPGGACPAVVRRPARQHRAEEVADAAARRRRRPGRRRGRGAPRRG
jgi:hypothetical protein